MGRCCLIQLQRVNPLPLYPPSIWRDAVPEVDIRGCFAVGGVEDDPSVFEFCWVIQQPDLDMYPPLSIDRMRNRGVRRGRIRVHVMVGWVRTWSRCILTTAPSCFASDSIALVIPSLGMSWTIAYPIPTIVHASGGIVRVGSRSAVSSIGLSTVYRTCRLCWWNNTSTLGPDTAEEDSNACRWTPRAFDCQLSILVMKSISTTAPMIIYNIGDSVSFGQPHKTRFPSFLHPASTQRRVERPTPVSSLPRT